MKNLKSKEGIIFTDNFEYLKKKNKNYLNKIIISFSIEEIERKNLYSFYDFIDYKRRIKLCDKKVEILNYFNKNLEILHNPALKKNLCKIFYTSIGIYPFFDAINNITKKNKKILIYTQEKKINDIFKYFIKKNSQLNFEKNNISFDYNLSKIHLLKLLTTNEIKFHLERKYNSNFSNLNNLRGNHFMFTTIDPSYCEIKNKLNKEFKKKIIISKKLNINKITLNKKKNLKSILKACKKVNKKYFKNNNFFRNYLINEMRLFFYNYDLNYKYYYQKFKNVNSKIIFLTKTIRNPINTSIYDVGKNLKKKFFWVTHQHGHGIEMTKNHLSASLTKEETLADLCLVYSKKGMEKRYKNIHIKKNIKITDIGFNRNLSSALNLPRHDVLYLSAFNQELSAHEINMSNFSNYKKLIIEKKIIEYVFSRINKITLFKDYPGEKYSGIKHNFISSIIKNHKNIKYFYQRLNAENIVLKSPILITSLASSTIGPCIQSGKPLIFIDFRSVLPVDQNIVSEFKKYFFYFKYDKQFYNRLRNFLNKDYGIINKMWENKNSKLKEKFINNYFNVKEKNIVLKNLTSQINKFAIK